MKLIHSNPKNIEYTIFNLFIFGTNFFNTLNDYIFHKLFVYVWNIEICLHIPDTTKFLSDFECEEKHTTQGRSWSYSIQVMASTLSSSSIAVLSSRRHSSPSIHSLSLTKGKTSYKLHLHQNPFHIWYLFRQKLWTLWSWGVLTGNGNWIFLTLWICDCQRYLMVVALQGKYLGASFVVELDFMVLKESLSFQFWVLPLKLTLLNR